MTFDLQGYRTGSMNQTIEDKNMKQSMEQFSRTALLVGTEGVDKLKNARVAVFGIGGVGAMWWRRSREAASVRWI